MAIADTQDESLGSIVAFGGPSRRARGLQHEALVRQVTLEHRREAVHVAAPVELPRELQLAVASRFERGEQARRLIVVFLLPPERQRNRETLARNEREREVDQRELRKHRTQPQVGGIRIEARGRVRNADVVALDIEVHELERVDYIQRQQAVMRERPPVRTILEHVTVHAAVASHGQQRGPLVDGNARIVGLYKLRAAEPSSIELHDVRDAGDTVADQPGEDPPLALGPLPEVALARVQEALGVTAPLAGRDRFAEHLDVLARHHLQATTAEYAIDLLGSHGNTTISVTMSAARSTPAATRPARRVCRGSRRTTRTVASSLLPRARASARSLPQRRTNGSGPCSTRLNSCGSTCLCTPSLQMTSISPRCRATRSTFGSETAPLPTMRAGSSYDPPGGGVSPRCR